MSDEQPLRPPPTPSFHYKMRIESLESKVALLGGGVDGGELVEVLQEREAECAAQRAHIEELEQKLRVAGKTLVASERRARGLRAPRVPGAVVLLLVHVRAHHGVPRGLGFGIAFFCARRVAISSIT